jgi:protein TonB
MLDSTARAERIDLASSEAAFYTWEVAQKPVVVRLPMALIDRLESQAVESFRSLTSRGSEIGGLLLGSITPGSPSIVTVADFELVSCDYSRGPLYRLSEADMERFEQAIEKHGGGAGAGGIGYFRSHTRKGLSLDAEDLAFFEPRFHEPQNMVLLIRPFATKASTAAIFIRENGRIGGETSYLEFPFRSSELGSARRSGEKSEPAPPLPVAATAPAQPATPPRAQSRAQIVPIASRREIAPPYPAAPPPAPAPLVADRPAASAPATPKTAPAAPAADREDRPEKAEKAAKQEKQDKDKVAAAQPQIPVEAVLKPAPPEPAEVEFEPLAPAGNKNKKLRLLVAAALGMLVLVGGSLVVYPMLRKSSAPRPVAIQQDSSPLSLRVERTSGGMLLTWNRDLPVIQSATKVVLAITDGDRHENIQLDPNQVRTGSILYPPITGDVSFQMEVTDPHQSKTTSESLRVLDPRPSPLAEPSAAQSASKQAAAISPAATNTAVPATTAATETTPAVDVQPQEDTPAAHPIALRPFNSESLAQRLRPVSSTDLPDAPAILRSSGPASASLPGIVPSQVAPPAPTKQASTADTQPGGQLKQAQILTRVDPEYPRLAREAGASGVVELEATISVDGKVKNPRVVHGNSMLQKAALDAVLQWRYKPAQLNGKAVESPVEIKLNFVQGH